MPRLTEEGQRIVADIAQRHGISVDAATHMLHAVSAGHGTQAQFNHPELGGMGQWSQGGLTMVGDMFNNALKARVDTLCAELSEIVRNHSLFSAPMSSQSQSQGTGQGVSGVSLFVAEASDWPAELGQPSSVGTQNDVRYAYFPEKRRLAIKVGGMTSVYDTGEHRIGGFGQAQGGGQSLSFTSQFGLVRVADLPLASGGSGEPASHTAEPSDIGAEEAPVSPVSPASPAPDSQAAPKAAAPQAMSDDQIFSRIERLAELFEKGILKEAEYEAKKSELLARL